MKIYSPFHSHPAPSKTSTSHLRMLYKSSMHQVIDSYVGHVEYDHEAQQFSYIWVVRWMWIPSTHKVDFQSIHENLSTIFLHCSTTKNKLDFLRLFLLHIFLFLCSITGLFYLKNPHLKIVGSAAMGTRKEL